MIKMIKNEKETVFLVLAATSWLTAYWALTHGYETTSMAFFLAPFVALALIILGFIIHLVIESV